MITSVQGLDWFSNGEYETLVLELVPGTSLFDLIELNGTIAEDVARGVFIQVGYLQENHGENFISMGFFN